MHKKKADRKTVKRTKTLLGAIKVKKIFFYASRIHCYMEHGYRIIKIP